jgi:hypothetical protein
MPRHVPGRDAEIAARARRIGCRRLTSLCALLLLCGLAVMAVSGSASAAAAKHSHAAKRHPARKPARPRRAKHRLKKPYTAGPKGSSSTAPDPAFMFGYNDDSAGEGLESPAFDAFLTSFSGANVVRTGLNWLTIEPTKGTFHWGATDALYSAMIAKGIRPIWILQNAPSWTWSSILNCLTLVCPGMAPATAHVGDGAALAAMAAQRYPQSAGIEVWNEPNITEFWKPTPDPGVYTNLLKAVYAAVKKVDPTMPVVLGGLAGSMQTNGNWSQTNFLSKVFAYGGGTSMNAVSLHYYLELNQPGGFAPYVQQLRDIRNQYGFGSLPIWITEVGMSTGNPGVTGAIQASWLVAMYKQAQAMGDVQTVIIHQLMPYGPIGIDSGYSVLNRNFSTKPAFCALGELRLNPPVC